MPDTVWRRKRLAQALLLVALALLLVACETVRFYTQAVRGQLAIVFAREDIQRLLSAEDLAPGMEDTLREVLRIRDFARAELTLPVGDNYSSYVDVGREHVVWNVFAAPEFSTDPVNWCFPIAGCVSYRGYFSEEGAQRFAAALEEEGFDVYTGGVDAYSTLGWFDDSLLSTVLGRDSHQLAGLVFHELAHQVVYVPGDTTFNESFATAVEREGIRRWLIDSGRPELIARTEGNQQRQQEFVALVTEYRDRLDSLYDREIPEPAMRVGKAELQEELRAAYDRLRQGWDGYNGYDSWFARSLNNAQLGTVASYNDLVPFFDALLAEQSGDLSAFYREVEALAELEDEERETRLAEWRQDTH